MENKDLIEKYEQQVQFYESVIPAINSDFIRTLETNKMNWLIEVIKDLEQLEQPKPKTTQDEVSFTWYEIIGILSNKNHHLYDYMIRYFGELEDYDESPYIGDGKDKSFNYDLILCFDENCNEFNHLELGIFNFKTDYLEVRKVYNNG